MTDVICSKCGHHNQAGANFCSSCGAEIARPSEDPPTITFSLDPEPPADAPPEIPDPSPQGALLVTRGPNTGSEFVLEQTLTTVGRHPESDIFLDDVTVSRRHVEIERRDGGAVVRDVGSLNGTYLNQHRIEEETAIANGDELQVGKFKLLYVVGEDA